VNGNCLGRPAEALAAPSSASRAEPSDALDRDRHSGCWEFVAHRGGPRRVRRVVRRRGGHRDRSAVSSLVRDTLAGCRYEPPAPGSTIGAPWSSPPFGGIRGLTRASDRPERDPESLPPSSGRHGRVPDGRTCTRMPPFERRCKQTVCATRIGLLQHSSRAITAPNKSPRRMSMSPAFGSARTIGLLLELGCQASHLTFHVARVGPTTPKHRARDLRASVDPTNVASLRAG
jgi:hypothetical protein